MAGRKPRTIQRLSDGELTPASLILTDAAQPLSAGARPLWSPDEIDIARCREWQRRGELFGGFEGGELAAVFCLCQSDADLWPEALLGEALYLHKLAVRSAWRGSGWTEDVIGWAAERAAGQGCRSLRLDTVAGSRLCSHYEAHGFLAIDKATVRRGSHVLAFFERRH